MASSLRTFELEKHGLNENDLFKEFLTATAYAIRSTYHTTLQATPGQLIFGRDMILPIRLATNWARIAQRKQERINESNACEIKKRIHYEYKVGDKVLLEKPGILQKMTSLTADSQLRIW